MKRDAINRLSSLLLQCFVPDVSILVYFGAYSPNIVLAARMGVTDMREEKCAKNEDGATGKL